MRILIACGVAPESLPLIQSNSVSYRPDLESREGHALRHTLINWYPDFLLTKSLPEAQDLGHWDGDVIVLDSDLGLEGPAIIGQSSVHYLADSLVENPEIQALEYCDHLSAELMQQPVKQTPSPTDYSDMMQLVGGLAGLVWSLNQSPGTQN